MLFGLLGSDGVGGAKFVNESGPFGTEDVCACERTVATAYNEGVDPFDDEVMGRGESTFLRTEYSRASRSY